MQICNLLLTQQLVEVEKDGRSRNSNLRAQSNLSGPSIHDFSNPSLALMVRLSYTFL